MKLRKSLPFGIFFRLFPVLSFFLLAGWADTWEGIAEKAGTIETVRAEFVQEKHLEILSEPLISKGRMLFKSPRSLRWEYSEPFQSVLLTRDGKVERFVKGDEGFIKDEGTKIEAMRVVMDEIALWMGGRFKDNPNFDAALEPGPKIVLVPKEKALASIIKRIELSLSATPGLIDSVSIFENETTFTKLVFTDAQLNGKIEDSLFERID